MLLGKVLILLIALGDFLVGCYLITVSVYNDIYKQQYCWNQYTWLTRYGS